MLLPAIIFDFLVYAEWTGLSKSNCYTSDCLHENRIEALWLLGFFAVAFGWWVWGMVSANVLARKHNAMALLLYHRLFTPQEGGFR